MTTPTALSLKKLYSGKVRDLYEIDAQRMLMVASDRLSAFDVILDEPIPEKGKILTAISNFWFDKLKDLVPNHFTGDQVEDVVPAAELPLVEGRAVVAKRLKPVAVEAIVRGYIVGSGWKEYQKSGTVCGIQLPAGLKEAAKLPRADLHPVDQGRGRRSRREHLLRAVRSDHRQGAGRPGARHLHRPVPGGRRVRRHARASSSPTPSSSSAWMNTAP